jgi:hypothetical protein
MSKAKRTERETKIHIDMLEYTAEKAERELTAMHEAKDRAERDAQKDADYLAARVHEHVKRVKAARALIAELDVYTDACVVKEQAANIVDILIQSARDLSFHTWVRSTRQGPDDKLDDAKAEIATTEAFPDVDIEPERKTKNIPFKTWALLGVCGSWQRPLFTPPLVTGDPHSPRDLCAQVPRFYFPTRSETYWWRRRNRLA